MTATWVSKMRELHERQRELHEVLLSEAEGTEEEAMDAAGYHRIRRFSDLLRGGGGGLGAVSKWKAKMATARHHQTVASLRRSHSHL
ncbi:hypothetical protein MAR_029935 [Mya arenaria]|uniref:Uncharacterized protein n=1 Tax=Mya arenaria TaxID=6604 RepID=A0ABY7DKP0_MYAAR|nr:hypothetical protein MAR_029935 [Mya arenaria]